MRQPLDPATEAIRQRFIYDTPFWAGGINRGPNGEIIRPGPSDFQGVAKIVNKRAQLVPAIANDWQLSFNDALEAQRAAGLPMRAIICKARKLGFSTWIALKFLQRLTMLPYQFAIICAQDTDTAGQIFNMANRAYGNLPDELTLPIGFPVKPGLVSEQDSADRKYLAFGQTVKELRRKGDTGVSALEIDTARTPEGKRGYSPTMGHLSEVAWWEGEAAGRKMLALLNAIPYVPETIICLESTANGLNHFHRRYMAARDGAADPETGETYVAIFVPWWRDGELQMPFPSLEARGRFIEGIGDTRRFGEAAEDEPMLMELYGCTPEQLLWRRSAIRTQHDGNVPLFKQEYPASDDEAFIGSGRTVFGSILVQKAIQRAASQPEPVQGTLRPEKVETRRTRRGTVDVPVRALWVPSEAMRAHDPLLEVWEHPVAALEASDPSLPPAPTAASSQEQVDEYARLMAEIEGSRVAGRGAGAYVVACDVALGEADTFSDGDFHAVSVFDHHTLEQVAVHASRMDLHDLPSWLYLIGLYYNEALLAIEVNGPGIAIVDTLHKDMRYPNLYRRKRIDKLSGQAEKKAGWQTDRATKRALEVTFGEALGEDTVAGIRDVRTARELTTYVVDDKGRTGALHGEHDDRLMASMIGRRVAETERPRSRGGRRGLREPEDRVTGY